jgi:hypothetical protein
MKAHHKDIVEKYKHLMDHPEYFELVLAKLDEVLQKTGKPIIEVGTNKGGSSICMMELLAGKANYLIGLDPYGSLPYHNGADIMPDGQYSNSLYYDTMLQVYGKAKELNVNYTHLKQSSLHALMYWQWLELYNNAQSSSLKDGIAFIYLDGTHDPQEVQREIKFFSDYLDNPHGCLIVDDYKEERFKGFWEPFFEQNPHLYRTKTIIPDKAVVEFK